MSGVQGTQHTQPNHPMSQAQGSAASGQIDPRLAGVVRHGTGLDLTDVIVSGAYAWNNPGRSR